MARPAHTPGPWSVSGVRFRMNGGEWHNINRYDEARKQDENIACVGYDPRTGVGLADAHLIAAAPELLTAATDALAGWRYIRAQHGDLYGVGWDRVEDALSAAIAKATT